VATVVEVVVVGVALADVVTVKPQAARPIAAAWKIFIVVPPKAEYRSGKTGQVMRHGNSPQLNQNIARAQRRVSAAKCKGFRREACCTAAMVRALRQCLMWPMCTCRPAQLRISYAGISAD
jgi:hypothetical protein